MVVPLDEDFTEGTASSLTQETRHGRIFVERAVRHELRIPLRYRREGHQDWSPGESINMSESGILFSSNEMLEVDARVEITFQTSGAPLLQSSTRQASVVRRTLSNWPETRVVFGARFRS
jgi:PilZ domain